VNNDLLNLTNESELQNSINTNLTISPVLEITNLVKTFGSKHVLNGIDISLEKGKVLGILGPNGQGKTTLLNIISGLFKPTGGEIKVNGINVQKLRES